MKTLSKDEFEQKMTDALVVNVLPEKSYNKEHIPGSINVPIESPDFVRRMDMKLNNKNDEVIVYCASFDCDASTRAAEKLKNAGYKKVYDFKGGMQEWKDGGGDVESGGVSNFRNDSGSAQAGI